MAKRRTDVFDNRIDKTTALIAELAKRAEVLPAADKALFAEALEELQTTFEELQVAGEELSQQAEELSASRLVAEEGRQKYFELFDQAPDAYLVTDDQGLIVEANERAGRLLGVRPALLLKKPLVVYVDPTDRQAFFDKLADLKTLGRVQDWEARFRPRKGAGFTAHVDVAPIPGPAEVPAGFRWLVRDATEAKKREEQARLATFPELDPQPVVEIDTAGHIYYINPAAKQILRGLPEKGLDHPWLAGLTEAAEKLWRSRRKSLVREVEVDGRWFLQSLWSPGRGGRLRIYGREITARKVAELKLQLSEQSYRDLVDNANSIIIRWKPDGTISYFNRFARSFFGYSEKEILGRDVRLLVPPTDSAGQDLTRLIEEIATFPELHASHENENVLRDGRRVWVQWTNKALRDSQGHLYEIQAIGNDVTARREAEEKLHQYQGRLEDQVRERTADLLNSSELLERVFASVDVAMAYLDPDFNFLRVNRAFADAFGQMPSWYPGKNLFALYPDASALDVFRKVVETGEPHTELASPFLQDGPSNGAYWDWSLQRVGAGDLVAGVVLSMVNVTPRMRAEEERRRLSTAIEQSSEGIVITDDHDRIVYANPTFNRLHGLSGPGSLDRPYGEIAGFDREDADFRDRLRETLDRGGVWKGRLTRPVGEAAEGKLDVTISPIREPGGRIVNYAVLEHDATVEHRLETSVRNLQKLDALGALAGGIAHDLNNILVPIFLNAELAGFEVEKNSPTSRNLELILEAANRGRELVRQIIAFSRPTEQRRNVIDMVAVVKEAVRFLRSSIPQSIAIVELYTVAKGRVRADPTQIGQVVLNLGTNAAYAMREQGGQLTIGLTDVVIDEESMAQNPELGPGPYIKLTAADTGSGMTAAVLERIFEPFFTTKRRGEGTGMGLSVVRGIVQSHGGAIQVASVPGQGTTFDVYLPAASGVAAPARTGAGAALMGKGRILFVDDEDLLVRSVKPMLERLGFSVTSTTDPQEALNLFRDHPMDFDLVITDQTMPGLTGDRLAQKLLGIRPAVPIILSTGFSETVREDELSGLGIRGFIMKPFSMSEIGEKIRAALKKA